MTRKRTRARRGRQSAAMAALMLLVLATGTRVSAAEIRVGAGSTLRLGSAVIDLGCAALTVAGGLAAGSARIVQALDVSIWPGGLFKAETSTLQVAGDWSNDGSFDAGTGSVEFLDGCGRASALLLGSTRFTNLTMMTETGKLYQLESGVAQTITQLLRLQGAAGNLLVIRSTSPGLEASIDLQGTQALSLVDVEDNHAVGAALIVPPDSLLGPNTPGWTTSAALPLLTLPSLGLLALALMCLGRAMLRRKELA